MINICHWYRHHEGFLVLGMNLAIIPSCSEKCNVINCYAYELSIPLENEYVLRADIVLRCLSLG